MYGLMPPHGPRGSFAHAAFSTAGSYSSGHTRSGSIAGGIQALLHGCVFAMYGLYVVPLLRREFAMSVCRVALYDPRWGSVSPFAKVFPWLPPQAEESLGVSKDPPRTAKRDDGR